MSILDLGTNGWRAFWSNTTAPGAFGIYFLVLIVSLLIGVAFHSERSMLMLGIRAVCAVMAAVMIVGVIGVLGLNLNGLTPVINWFLTQIQAPFYIPVK
ncbi:hypothetical protein [Bifidobacterium sp. SO1]|uniref:hypothetical protein n=1 Tax=Bifidobacterium sp. SO1 TaxID=2809029 RepID=UPI001BDCDB2B|nr:hypothetical protein [Bifidobacterium sp. SO1]MBT1161765.1 hypothetical protein [Bifidobacterium sp. SO1]